MTEEQIKKASLYKLANRLYILGSMKPTQKVEDEYNLIVEEMWARNEIYKSNKGVKKMVRSKNERRNTRIK